MPSAFTTYVTSFPPFTGTGSSRFKPGLIDKMRSVRLAECPVARTTSYYVDVSTTLGTSTGGPGAGTSANPWLVATTADLATLIAANDADDVAWYFKSGAKVRPDPTNPTVSPLPAGFSMSFSTYGGADPFEVCGFVKEQTAKSGAWTNIGNSTYTKTFTNRVIYWIRYDEAASTRLTQGTERVFKFYATDTDISGSGPDGADSFSITTSAGTSTLTVRLSDGTTPSAKIEVAMVGGVYGINATAGGVRCDNLCFYGFGLNDRNAEFQNINTTVGGTNNFVATNCSSFYTAKHAITQTNGGTAGGFVTLDNIKVGLVLRPTTGGDYISTGLIVFYSFDGAHEGVATNIYSQYGGLPEKEVANSPTYDDRGLVFPVYMHTGHSDGSTNCTLCYVYNSVISDGAWSCDRNSTFADPGCPLPTNSVAFTEYRCFICSETYSGTRAFTAFKNVMGWAYINCWYAGKVVSSYTTNTTTFLAPSAVSAAYGAWIGAHVNCIYDTDWTSAADNASPLNICFNSDINSDMIFSHVHFNNRSGTGKQIHFQNGVHTFVGSGDMTTYNARFANILWTTNLSSASPSSLNLGRNQAMGTQTSYSLPLSDAAASPTGGINGIRVYTASTTGVADGGGLYGVSSATNYAAISTLPTVGASPNADLVGTGTSSFIVPEYDINWNRRNTSKPSFGPVDRGGSVAKKLNLLLDRGRRRRARP